MRILRGMINDRAQKIMTSRSRAMGCQLLGKGSGIFKARMAKVT